MSEDFNDLKRRKDAIVKREQDSLIGPLQEQIESLKTENTQLKASALNKRVEELRHENKAIDRNSIKVHERSLELKAENQKLQEQVARMGEAYKKMFGFLEKQSPLPKGHYKTELHPKCSFPAWCESLRYFSNALSTYSPDWMEGKLREAVTGEQTVVISIFNPVNEGDCDCSLPEEDGCGNTCPWHSYEQHVQGSQIEWEATRLSEEGER